MKSIIIFILGIVAGAFLHEMSIVSADEVVDMSNKATDRAVSTFKNATK